MQIIPNIPKIEDYELLQSYLIRLSNANHFLYDSEEARQWFPLSWYGMGNAVINLCEQINEEPLAFLFKHTTLESDQIFLTRQEHIDFIDALFENNKKIVTENPFNTPVYISREEAIQQVNDIGYFYVDKDLQFASGYSYGDNPERYSPTLYSLSNAMQSNVHSLSKSKPISHKNTPSDIDRRIFDLLIWLDYNHIPLCYEDIMMLVENRYCPKHFTLLHSMIEIEDFNNKFFGQQMIYQEEYVSDAFVYYKKLGDDKNILRNYKNIVLGMIATAFDDIAQLTAVCGNPKSLFETVRLRAGAMGYDVLSDNIGPIIKIKKSGTKHIQYVSVYKILDHKL